MLPGSLFDRRSPLPVHSHVDVSGTSQVPRRSFLRLCPDLRPRPNRRLLAIAAPSMLRRGLPGWAGQSLKHGGRVVGHHTEAFVGIDTSKLRNAIAIADGGRGGEVRFLGEFLSTEAAIRKLVAKLAATHCHLTFCYE